MDTFYHKKAEEEKLQKAIKKELEKIVLTKEELEKLIDKRVKELITSKLSYVFIDRDLLDIKLYYDKQPLFFNYKQLRKLK